MFIYNTIMIKLYLLLIFIFIAFAQKQEIIDLAKRAKIHHANQNNVYAGFGYDSINQEQKLPVYESEKYVFENNIYYKHLEFYDVSDFLKNIYNNPNAFGKTYREGADTLFTKFYGSGTRAILNQKLYITNNVTSTSIYDEYFIQAISLLPEIYDENLYSLITNFWGDSSVHQAYYGGMVENIIATKVCHNPEVADIQKYIDQYIGTQEYPKDLKFLKYTSFSSIDIIGGNPEKNITDRVKTFITNPVFIYGTKRSITDSIKNLKIRNNLEKHIENINNKITKYIEYQQIRIKELYLEEAKSQQYIVHHQTPAIGIVSDIDCNRVARPDCCHYSQGQNGFNYKYTTSCINNIGKIKAFGESYDSGLLFKEFINYTIDGNGYYQIYKDLEHANIVYPRVYTQKFKSGCIISSQVKPTMLIWQKGLFVGGYNIIYCINCNPYIRRERENEYLECGCQEKN